MSTPRARQCPLSRADTPPCLHKFSLRGGNIAVSKVSSFGSGRSVRLRSTKAPPESKNVLPCWPTRTLHDRATANVDETAGIGDAHGVGVVLPAELVDHVRR